MKKIIRFIASILVFLNSSHLKQGNKDIVLNNSIKKKLKVVFVFFLIIFLIILVRCTYLSLFNYKYTIAKIIPESVARVFRHDILDRNGNALAVSVPSSSVYVRPRLIKNKQKVAEAISSVFTDISYKKALDIVNSKMPFVWLERKSDPSLELAIRQYGISGIGFNKEYARFYPYGEIFSHVVGITDIDNIGQMGAELSFNDRLKKENVQLSLDANLQSSLFKVLSEGYLKNEAKSAFAVLSDVNSGEVLAMVSLPNFNPNNRSTLRGANRFNSVTQGVYEFGSVMKFISMAIAIESGKEIDETYDVSKPVMIGSNPIVDFSYMNRKLDLPEVLMYSSNIASALIAQDIGPYMQKSLFRELGLTSVSGIELIEKAKPLYPNYDKWQDISAMTISYGYGIAITQINFIAAVNTIVNGGYYNDMTILKKSSNVSGRGRKVLSDRTSEYMRAIGRLVVAKGYGSRANVRGYAIGGKTGSAEKGGGKKGYDRGKNLSSFIAYFPVYKPKYSLIVSIDEPKKNAYNGSRITGGIVAARVVKNFVNDARSYLAIEPLVDPVYKVDKYDKRALERYVRGFENISLGDGS